MFSRILEHKATLTAAIILFVAVAAGGAYYLLKPQTKQLTLAQAQVMDIQESISADGSVDSDKSVSLSFQKAGIVTAVNAKVGDHAYAGEVLAEQDNGQLRASLEGANADVASAEANLAAVQKGATSQTLAVYQQGVSAAASSLATADNDAYLKIQDAILNKITSLYQNGTSPNPTILIPTDSQSTAISLNSLRLDMTSRLAKWNSLLGQGPTADQTLSEAVSDIAAAKSFMDALASAANRLTPGNSGLTTDAIAGYVAAVNGASTEVNAADSEFSAALQAFKAANDQLAVIQASSTPEAVQVAEAALAKAQANVASLQSQLSDTMLIAPWAGIVASVDPKAGESFPAATPAIDLISAGAYKVDVMIPENEVALIAVNDPADISFDAYGSGLAATGTVSSIDLAPTVTNGASAYKATVYLSGSDPRIRTGMTANVTIHGASVQGAVAVPSSAIITRSDGSYVLAVGADGSYHEQKVQTGISDGDWTQVISGIQAGQAVAAFGGQQ
ncbi:MAG: efflux RND transporter periplasmic adaptor subunit [Patescibacteria group bacterium]|nr:efflux RND transporter periplasmic adaptor subunit [Patescibacteria group bacterium]